VAEKRDREPLIVPRHVSARIDVVKQAVVAAKDADRVVLLRALAGRGAPAAGGWAAAIVALIDALNAPDKSFVTVWAQRWIAADGSLAIPHRLDYASPRSGLSPPDGSTSD
jgi:hypothetical protein